jgi:hypothetical protein
MFLRRMHRWVLVSLIVLAAAAFSLPQEASSSPQRVRFVEQFTDQPSSRVVITIKQQRITFRAYDFQVVCEGEPDVSLSTFALKRVPLTESGSFRRTKHFVNQYGTEYRTYASGSIVGSQATGEFYDSNAGGQFGSTPLGPDCSTPGTVGWVALRE